MTNKLAKTKITPDRNLKFQYDPKDKPPYFGTCSPIADAFKHAVLAGIMRRTDTDERLAENDTLYFQYLGDETRIRIELQRTVITHHFRNVISKAYVVVDAPVDYARPPQKKKKTKYEAYEEVQAGKVIFS